MHDWREQGNYANDSEKGYNEDAFNVEVFDPADEERDINPVDKNHDVDTESHEHAKYAATIDVDECNNVRPPAKQEVVMDSGATDRTTGNFYILHCVCYPTQKTRQTRGQHINLVEQMGNRE
ncbi:hypothetical protein H310_12600 [Aphanomyces invadans]|uniref:Uncharacterized protein n=1 Tax=Aphanomyces invadans TaxID=157072 RepID=A0A024TIZ3_9STRA|nr:hypothetical protein H310_12600 [Aphanomyces invadans]ETV93312.1 hypothetical protein H310_12600 [Aphanomyces invadans]|eukprot:XP_008877948.1 hypothetical protein H310_12600 [Aphanomyces invadans]